MKRTCLLVLASLGLLATACGGGGAPSALAGQSAKQVLTTSLAAARTSGSVHFTLLGKQSGKTETIVGDASATDGREVITVGALSVEAEVTGGQAFIEGNVGGLEDQIGLSAAQAQTYAGKWISIATTDSPYASVTKAVTIASTLTQIEPNGHLSLTAATTKAGRSVIGVSGGLPGPATKGTTGSATLYVSSTRPTVPIVFTAEQTTGGVRETDVGTFSRWGQPVQIPVPTSTVAFSSLPGSSSAPSTGSTGG